MHTAIRQNWWILAIKGVIAITFGIVAFILPMETIITLTQIFGGFIIVSGLFVIALLIYHGRKSGKYWHWFAIDAIFDLLLGILILSFPETTIMLLTYFIAFWFLFMGALQIVFAIMLYDTFKWWWFPLANGIITTILGLLIIFYPFEGVKAFTYLVGFAALFYGIIHILTTVRIRKAEA